MGKKVGVILSGCGVKDGAEIHESVCTLLALDRAGAQVTFLAPDREQSVISHQTGKVQDGKRNVREESARIARGPVRDVAEASADEFDAIILPGGFGAAKNLSTFASDGEKATVDPGVAKLIRSMHAAGKPVGALCIAPAVLAAVLGPDHHPELTIGTDSGVGGQIEAMGARHVPKPVTEVVVDRKNRIVTTPCYMLAGRISEVADGAEKAVKALLELAG